MFPGADHHQLLALAAGIVGRQAAEDVVQDAYVWALSGPPHRGESTVQTWLYTIVKREAVRSLRRRQREAEAPSSADVAIEDWRRPELPGVHESVWCQVEAGYTGREGAKRLNMRLETYRRLVEEAREWLRDNL